jgi:hypothetical protein
MTSLFAKLPPELQVEFEPIRRRLAAPFPRITAQKIFDDYAEPIGKVLALGLSHPQLAEILFELGLTGKDGKQPKINSISRSLNRSRQTNPASKLVPGGTADPGPFQQNGASHITRLQADDLETTGVRSSARFNGHVVDVSASTTARPIFETDAIIGDDGPNSASCRVHCCPLYRRRGFAAEPSETRGQCSELVDHGAGRSAPAPEDKARQDTENLDKMNHAAVRQGPAALDKARPDPAAAGADHRHGPCRAIQSAGAPDTSDTSDAAAKTGIVAATPHAAQAQFPIPPPLTPAQHFARACAAGESLIKLKLE